MATETEQATMITRLHIRQDALDAFSDWQMKLHLVIATFPGFVSLEISAPSSSSDSVWIVSQRFEDNETLNIWNESEKRKEILKEVKSCLFLEESKAIQDHKEDIIAAQSGATEIFVTHVNPDQVRAYREWIGKIHRAEAKFPGFRRVYVQAPRDEKSGSWITMVQFDNAGFLDAWLNSKERQAILQEGSHLIHSLESHRVASSFAGWFSPARTGLVSVPPVWKQTMVVLLVLFPIVMLELKYLGPVLSGLNPSLDTFIRNAISVILLAWPVTPFAIGCLTWWLNPKPENAFRISLWGALLVVGIYVLEIAALWNLL